MQARILTAEDVVPAVSHQAAAVRRLRASFLTAAQRTFGAAVSAAMRLRLARAGIAESADSG